MATKILVGDCRQTLKQIPDKSVHCVITSPPYWGLRAYKGDTGMIGLEPTWQNHLDNLLEVFNGVWRVMRDDGTLWLNYGDAYAGSGKAHKSHHKNPGLSKSNHRMGDDTTTIQADLLPAKNLMQLPARLSIAMQEHGWILRSEIVWAKKNCMPESVKDRPTMAHEKIFLFVKRAKYFYDHVAVRQSAKESSIQRAKNRHNEPPEDMEGKGVRLVQRWANKDMKHDTTTASMRNVWHLPTQSLREAHFATFPTKLVEPCIKAGTSEHGVCAANGSPYKRIVKIHDPENRLGKGKGGWGNPQDKAVRDQKPSKEGAPQYLHGGWEPTCECEGEIKPAIVLDPFGGAGTVSVVSERLGRDSIICEISPEYAEIARKRIEGENLPMFPTTIEVIK